jgi:hypothetical protein
MDRWTQIKDEEVDANYANYHEFSKLLGINARAQRGKGAKGGRHGIGMDDKHKKSD